MITKNRFFRKDSKETIFLSLYPLLFYSFQILSQIVNHIFEGIYKVTELSYIRKLKELRKLRRVLLLKKLRQKDYCLNSSATIGSDNSFNSFNF